MERRGVDVSGLPKNLNPTNPDFGVAVENPGSIVVTNWDGKDGHAAEQLKARKISRQEVLEALANPLVVVKQRNNYLYIGKNQVVAITKDGLLKTAYNRVRRAELGTKDGYDQQIMDIVRHFE